MAGIKVFSATRARDRNAIGDKITEWLRVHNAVGVRAEVRQSSGNEYHCFSITLWFEQRSASSPRADHEGTTTSEAATTSTNRVEE